MKFEYRWKYKLRNAGPIKSGPPMSNLLLEDLYPHFLHIPLACSFYPLIPLPPALH